MNEIIRDIIRANVPELRSNELSFVKFNTSGSPSRTVPKVIFFGFVESESAPRVCIKTCRGARDNAAVAQGFEALTALYALDSTLFAKPLWNGQYDGVSYSIEAAMPGIRPRSSDSDRVIEAYCGFQKKAAAGARSMPASRIMSTLLSELVVEDAERAEIQRLCADVNDEQIIQLPQHGDFTADNTLVSAERVALIDCDWYMADGVAGFDLYHYLSRARVPAGAYFTLYRKAVAMERGFTDTDLLLWILQERVLKQRQGSPQSKEKFSVTFEKAKQTFDLA